MSDDSDGELWGYDSEDDPADAPTDPLRQTFGEDLTLRSFDDDEDDDEYEFDEDLDPLGEEGELEELENQPLMLHRELGWPFDGVVTGRVTRYLRVVDAERVRGWLVRLDEEEDFSEVKPARLARYWEILMGFRIHIGDAEYEDAVRTFLGEVAHAIDRCCDALDVAPIEPSTGFRDQLLRNGHAPSGVWMARLLLDRFRSTIALHFGSEWADKAVADRAFEASLREIREEADELALRSVSSHAHRLLVATSVGCSGWLFERDRVLSVQGLYRSLVEQSAAEESAPVEGPELEVLSEAVLQALDDEEADEILEAARFCASVAAKDDMIVVQLNVVERLDRMDSTAARLIADRLLHDVVAARGEGSEAAFHAAHTAREFAARDGDREGVAALEATWIQRAIAAPHGWASQKWVQIAADRA